MQAAEPADFQPEQENQFDIAEFVLEADTHGLRQVSEFLGPA